jgi:hypothetical protein
MEARDIERDDFWWVFYVIYESNLGSYKSCTIPTNGFVVETQKSRLRGYFEGRLRKRYQNDWKGRNGSLFDRRK